MRVKILRIPNVEFPDPNARPRMRVNMLRIRSAAVKNLKMHLLLYPLGEFAKYAHNHCK